MARPKNQVQRREELIEAALAAGSEKGLRSLSLTDVAHRAGLTRGAVLYYYEDLDALILEAHEAGVARLTTDRDRILSALDDPRERLWRAFATGLPQTPDDPLMRLLYEFDIFATSSSPHQLLLIRLYEHQLKTYQDIINAGVLSGHFAPTLPVATVAMTLVALEDAYGLYITAGGETVTNIPEATAAMAAVAEKLGCSPKRLP